MTENKFEFLRNLIGEHIRTEIGIVQNIEYIDFGNNLSDSMSNTSSVIYGRRGSGKTTLLRKAHEELKKRGSISVYIDCEQCKDYTYPNTLIFLLKGVFKNLISESKFTFFKRQGNIKNILRNLSDMMKTSDKKDVTQKTEKSEIDDASASLGTRFADIRGGHKRGYKEIKISKEEKRKIDELRHELSTYKNAIMDGIKRAKMKNIFLLLDDFYFVRKKDQPYVIDYIHRICKGSQIYFKMATVKHRSELYHRKKSIVGVQEGMEYQVIDLDCTLENIGKTEDFLKKMLINIFSRANLHLEDVFISGQNGFPRLVWASGGVPRDMLNILKYCLEEKETQSGLSGKKEINRAAKKFYQDKQKEIETPYMVKKGVQELFQKIWAFCIDVNNKTAFLIKTGQSDGKRDAFHELIDLRLVHLAKSGLTIKKRPGKSFDGYILDIGSYSDILPLREKNIKEIDLFKEYKRKGDSEFRSIVPILDWGQLNKIDEMRKTVAGNVIKKKNKKDSKRLAPQPLTPFFNKNKA